jgi:hypothetical protein
MTIPTTYDGRYCNETCPDDCHHRLIWDAEHPTPPRPVGGDISERVWQGRQSWDGELVTRLNGRKVRATVHRDGYDEQSWGRVHVWTGDEWNHVLTRNPREIGLGDLSYRRDEASATPLVKNALRLLVLHAAAIVGGE